MPGEADAARAWRRRSPFVVALPTLLPFSVNATDLPGTPLPPAGERRRERRRAAEGARRRGRSQRRRARPSDVGEADLHARERRRDRAVRGREDRPVLQVAEAVELAQARAARGEERGRRAVRPDEVERAAGAVARRDLELDARARRRASP